MRLKEIYIRTLAVGALASLGLNLVAAPTSVSSRAALGGNDFKDWAGLGPDGTALGDSFSTSSQFGLGLSVSGATESASGFERANQGGSWAGNFAPGDALLWTGLAFSPQIITIDFASPIFGAGAQIQNDDLGAAFTAFLTAYDSLNNVVASYTFNGTSTDAGDNSAIFIGASNDLENISKIELGVDGSGSFAINRLDIKRTLSVPDSGEYLSAIFAMAFIAMSAARSVKRSHTAA
jgi:hypothetical protein